MPDTTERLTLEESEALIVAALMANRVSPANAASVARALVAAEIDGQKGHGFSRVAAYAAQSRSGKVVGHAKATIEKVAPACLKVDARHGFAYPAIDKAINALALLVAETGVAAAAVTRSHHCGQLGLHVERLANRGLIGLMVSNAPKAMAPWGGNLPLFGTNPIAFAAPIADALPLVIDLSLSKVARGKVMAAAKAGETIPDDWALDVDGEPTTDPVAALAGTMAPLGGSKGAALALVVEVLSATLTGANQSYETSSFFDAEGDPPGVGHFIIALDPDRILGADFAHRMASLAAAIDSQDGARLPGLRRLKARTDAKAKGLSVPAHLLEEVRNVTNA